MSDFEERLEDALDALEVVLVANLSKIGVTRTSITFQKHQHHDAIGEVLIKGVWVRVVGIINDDTWNFNIVEHGNVEFPLSAIADELDDVNDVHDSSDDE